MKEEQQLTTPFWTVRFVALTLTWAWALVAVGVGLNALLKFSQLKGKVKREIPPPTIVVIHDQDVFQTGAVVTTVSALIAVLCAFVALFHLRGPLSPPALRFQGALITFCGVGLFASLVPYTHFYRTRHAIVEASIGRVPLPANAVQTVERVLGLTSRYRDFYFLRLVAILPWFTILCSLITAAMLFMSAAYVSSKRGSAADIIHGSLPIVEAAKLST